MFLNEFINRGINKVSGYSSPKRTIAKHIQKNGNNKDSILIISHKDRQCGIHQYGGNIAEALQNSKKYNFFYMECSDKEELRLLIDIYKPSAIIYNYFMFTMSWLNSWITHSIPIPQLGIMHECYQKEADRATNRLFDYHICPDPTIEKRNPIIFTTPRLIPEYTNTKQVPNVITIGSFGFGLKDKGFERLVEVVQQEFDVANIRILMPFNDVIDKKGTKFTLDTADRCFRLIKKPGIQLTITHDFLEKPELLDFLASNTANAFFYDVDKYKGISSTIEHALAVQSPLIINKCGMFRHVFNAKPSICIEDSTIKEIIANGITPLQPFYDAWTEEKFIQCYEQMIDEVLK
jgi:hypothetical protein